MTIERIHTQTNERRRMGLQSALAAFQKETGSRLGELVGDLLVDLMHWCGNRNNYDFDAALFRAHDHYAAEVQRRRNARVLNRRRPRRTIRRGL